MSLFNGRNVFVKFRFGEKVRAKVNPPSSNAYFVRTDNSKALLRVSTHYVGHWIKMVSFGYVLTYNVRRGDDLRERSFVLQLSTGMCHVLFAQDHFSHLSLIRESM